MNNRTPFKLIALSVIASSSLLAATPSITDIEKTISVPKEVQPKTPALIEINKSKFAPTMSDDKSGKTVLVNDFTITGNSKIGEDELKKLLGEYMGKNLSFSQIQEATSVLTKYYRQQGYFVARVYVPVQNLQQSNGVVQLAVIEGNYGEFKLNNNSNVNTTLIQAMLDESKKDTVVSTHTLERSMLIINDTPGAVVTQADVKPGAQVGTSDFIISTESSKAYNGYVIADNYGSKYTSAYRTMAGVSLNNPLSVGDQLSLSGLLGTNTNLSNYRTAYSFPILANGLRGEVAYSKTDYELEKKYVTNQAIQGDSKTLEMTLSYPILRTRLENLNATLNYASKDMLDENDGVQTNKKTVDVVNIGLDYTKDTLLADFNTQYQASVTLSSGKLNIKDAAAKTNDEAGAKTDGRYEKMVVTLGNTTVFNPLLSLETSLSYQQALGNKNLDGSEDMSIGGNGAVRVYPDSEESAENGYILRAEGFYNLPTISDISHKASLFMDTAKVKQENNVDNTKARQLSDVGIGYHANYKDFFGKAHLARIIGGSNVESEVDNKEYQTKFLVQAGMVF